MISVMKQSLVTYFLSVNECQDFRTVTRTDTQEVLTLRDQHVLVPSKTCGWYKKASIMATCCKQRAKYVFFFPRQQLCWITSSREHVCTKI